MAFDSFGGPIVIPQAIHKAFSIRQPKQMYRACRLRQILVAEPLTQGTGNREHLIEEGVPVQAGVDDDLLQRGKDGLGACSLVLETLNVYWMVQLAAMAQVQSSVFEDRRGKEPPGQIPQSL